MMKKFFERYSYQCVTLFVNQVAIALFAISLAFAAGMAENDSLKLITSIFSFVDKLMRHGIFLQEFLGENYCHLNLN